MAQCATSTFVVDKHVCEKDALREKDARVRHLTESQKDRIGPDTAFVETDEAWLFRRNRCAFQADQVSCLEGAYAEREAVASALDWARVSDQARAARCGPHGQARWIVAERGSAAAYDGSGRLVAFALRTGRPAWSNYASFEASGNDIRFRTKDRGSMSCTTAAAGGAS